MNILMFGPNGSGKGTQGALIKKAFGLAHIESGAIFREHVGGGTELGKKAKEYMDRGELVPDSITIPMVLETLKTKGADGWLLDGFPRNIAQAEQLHKAMQEQGMKLDYVVEIDRSAKIPTRTSAAFWSCSPHSRVTFPESARWPSFIPMPNSATG